MSSTEIMCKGVKDKVGCGGGKVIQGSQGQSSMVIKPLKVFLGLSEIIHLFR